MESTIAPLGRLEASDDLEPTLDVRGWEVTTPAFATIGTVVELHVDVRAGRVRYLEVALGGDEPGARRLLLPIGRARIDQALDRIVVSTPSCLDTLPAYDDASFDREVERRILRALGESEGSGDFYACPAFDDGALAAMRRARAPRARRREEDAETGAPAPAGVPQPRRFRDVTGTEIRVVADDD